MGAAAGGAALAGAGYSAYEEGVAGKAQSAYYGYLADTAKTNEALAGAEETSETRDIGAKENQEQIGLTNKISETVGAQKAGVVTGVGASSRSAQDIISDTLNKGNLDEQALRLNADIATKNAAITAESREMNFSNEASGDNIAGANALSASKMQQVSSLLGGAGSVANSYYMGSLYAGAGRGYGGSGGIGSVQ